MKICIWGDNSGALKGETNGGGELQMALLAKALAKSGHEVVLIDYGTSEDFITIDGIKVLKINGWDDGIRIIRTLTHRLPRLYRSLKAQKADIYYCRFRDFSHIFAYWAARNVKAKFILGMASDLDAQSFRMRLKHYYLPIFNRSEALWWIVNLILTEIVQPRLLRKADFVFVQHEGQKKMLLSKKIKSVGFTNLIDLTQLPVISNPIQNDFIYVGSLDKRKGFAEFFKLVQKSNLHSFKIVGQPRDKTGYIYFEKLKSFENVSLLGRLNHIDTIYQIANSKALISTSPMEGFPNIFIEAWAKGIPVLSLHVDPGNIIEKEKLGIVAHGNLDKLLQAMNNIRNTKEFANRARIYVENNHSLNISKINKISNLFNELIKNET